MYRLIFPAALATLIVGCNDEPVQARAGSAAVAPPVEARAATRIATHQLVATRAPIGRAEIDIFYDRLKHHGSWVRHPQFSYVWLPRRGAGWRPYQEGRWVWTDDYGWFWESAEPFAWAVYHYGRWGYDPDYGWFWVRGDTWAPAWVTWRVGRGAIGWAPIAPDHRGFATGMPRAALHRRGAAFIPTLSRAECRNYFRHAGYVSI
jgi:hypothetical protein